MVRFMRKLVIPGQKIRSRKFLSTGIGEIPVPLPIGRNFRKEGILKFGKGVDQFGIATWQDRRWTGIAYKR